MPKYDRKCSTCETVFEVTCKISEKSNSHECTSCHSDKGEWIIGAPTICEAQRLSTSKKDTGFKEVLQKISSRNPRTSVNQQV